MRSRNDSRGDFSVVLVLLRGFKVHQRTALLFYKVRNRSAWPSGPKGGTMNERKMAIRNLKSHSPSRGWRAPMVAACSTTIMMSAAAGVRPHPSVENVTTGMLSHAIDLGPMSSTSPLDLTVWLKIRDSAGLDRALAVQRTTG